MFLPKRVGITVDVSERLYDLLSRFLQLITPPPSIEGARIMYIVEATHAPVPFQIVPPTEARDAEGNLIKGANFTYDISSDNEGALEVQLADDGKSGQLVFGLIDNEGGEPELANLNVLIRDAKTETVVGSIGAQFTIVAGDVATITGGSLLIPDLTEAPEPPPPPPVDNTPVGGTGAPQG